MRITTNFFTSIADRISTDNLLLAGVLAGTVFVFIIAYVNHKREQNRRSKMLDRSAVRKRSQFWENLYKELIKNRLFKWYMLPLTKRFSRMSIFSMDEIHRGVARYTVKLLLYVVTAFTVSCFLFDDIIAIILLTVFAYVFFSVKIERNLQNSVVRVYRDLRNAVQSIRLEFKKNHDVILALENARYGNSISNVMSDLKFVLTSPKGQEALNEFYEKVPFKQIQTLAMICYNINNTGDEMDAYNNSTFDEAMLVMNSDINQKIEDFDYETIKYGHPALEYLALLGIVGTIILRIMLSRMMPSLSVIYNSIAGIMIQDGTIFYSIYAYNKIAHAHIRQFLNADDRNSIVVWLMRKPFINKVMRNLAPQGADRRILERKLKLSFSKRTVEDVFCEKWVYAAVSFLVVLVIALSAPVIQKNFIRNYTGAFSILSSVNYKDSSGNVLYETDDILKMDEEYIAGRKVGLWKLGQYETEKEEQEVKQELQKFIHSYMPKLNTMSTEEQMTRLSDKYNALQKARFHWWYVLLAYFVAICAYMIPTKQLKTRLEVAKQEEEEEFLQLQMVMMILASMNFDTYEALGHLAQIAEIHKDVLTYCYYGYAANPVRELEKVERVTQSENFKQFILKMKETVEHLSIKEAFADLKADREHICNERAAYLKENVNRRRLQMGQLALRPLYMAIFGMMVFPVMYTGITGLSTMISQVSSL